MLDLFIPLILEYYNYKLYIVLSYRIYFSK